MKRFPVWWALEKEMNKTRKNDKGVKETRPQSYSWIRNEHSGRQVF